MTEPNFKSQFKGVGYPEVVAMVRAASKLQPAIVGHRDGKPKVFMLTEPSEPGTILAYSGATGGKLTELVERTRVDHPFLVVVRSDLPVYQRERNRGFD